MRNTLGALLVAAAVAVAALVAVAPAPTFAAFAKPNVDINDLSQYQGPTDLAPYPTVSSRSVRNVIFLIGDGMGLGQVMLARIKAVGLRGKLHMERLPVSGLINTHSADNLVTDSAAAGTALSSGIKTRNGMIGMTPDRSEYRTILEAAQAKGMATGLVATSAITHATPASFASHVRSRGDEARIAEQLLANEVDVLFGGGRKFFLPQSVAGSGRKDAENLLARAHQAGYTYVETGDQLKTIDSLPVIGLFQMGALTTLPPEPSLAVLTEKAIGLLGNERKGWFAQPRGFFLMVEGSQIDSAGHDNNAVRCVWQMLRFDEAVKAAMDFALADGRTLVVVTADHETGGLTIPSGSIRGSDAKIHWSTKGHTGTPVPVYAFGPGAEHFAGVYDNTDVPKKMAQLLRIRPWPQRIE
jgi:alkaline phosphatase